METAEVNRIANELCDIYSELMMAKYYLEDETQAYEEACAKADLNEPGADPWLEWDAKASLDKAEENWNRIEARRDEVEGQFIRGLGEPGTLSVINGNTVVVLLDNKFLVNGEILDDMDTIAETIVEAA